MNNFVLDFIFMKIRPTLRLQSIIYSLMATYVCAQQQDIPVLNIHPASVKKMDIINSPYRETNLCLTPDGKYLFFLSGRGGMPWSDPDYTSYRGKKEADGDIYFTKRTDSLWSKPVCLGQNVNTDMGEDEPNVTPDGQFVIFQSWREGWEKNGGPYYISELSGDEWGVPRPLDGGIHDFFYDRMKTHDWMYATDGSTLSPDGNTFIFAAGKIYDQPMDFYQSKKVNGQWSYPQKLDLSTDKDDRSVFMAADGKTLFFSSAGYGGYGGLDIFKTLLHEDGSHEDVINLGPAFNTSGDDYGFTMNSTGKEIFYLRDDDIYQMTVTNPDVLFRPLPTLVISGWVTDFYGNPVESSIRIINRQTRQVAGHAKSNRISGEYSVVVRKVAGEYSKEVTAAGYRKYAENFRISNPDSAELRSDRILLKKENTELIFFNLDQDTIPAGEFYKLDSIVFFLFKNKKYRVLLSGHADQSGTDAYNLDLSKRRVENVKNYFLSKGIPDQIMKAQYFGERHPLIPMPLQQELYLNRRVEIKLILPSV